MYIFIITNVIGPPAAAASMVPQNCGKPIVLIVINVTKKNIIKFGIYEIKNLKYLLSEGSSLKITKQLIKTANINMLKKV